MNIDFQNVFNIDASHGVGKTEFQNAAEHLEPFLAQIEQRNQGFYSVIDDETTLENIEKYAASIQDKYEDIVILGIGGSSLGAITLRDSFSHLFWAQSPRLHVLENIDPDMIAELLEAVELETTLFIVITKSGGTPETLAEYFTFRHAVESSGLKAKDHFVFVTGAQGLLREIAAEEEIITFDVPENVGGRFSVLTPVGLLPAALMGIDIRKLIKGAQDMRDQFLSTDFEKNTPFQIATMQYVLSQKGKTQNVLMPYATKLRSFAGWFAQLLGESTGKIDASGKHVGLTPIPALGVTDQHSQLQLYAQGSNDKLIMFLNVENFENNLEIEISADHEKVNFLKGKTFKNLLHAEQKATASSLTESDRPNLTINISDISEENIGTLFMLFEGATAFLGEYLEINAFDQPGVERSKVLTREYL